MLSGLTMRSGASRFPRSPSVVSCSPNLYNMAYTQQQIEPKVTKKHYSDLSGFWPSTVSLQYRAAKKWSAQKHRTRFEFAEVSPTFDTITMSDFESSVKTEKARDMVSLSSGGVLDRWLPKWYDEHYYRVSSEAGTQRGGGVVSFHFIPTHHAPPS